MLRGLPTLSEANVCVKPAIAFMLRAVAAKVCEAEYSEGPVESDYENHD